MSVKRNVKKPLLFSCLMVYGVVFSSYAHFTGQDSLVGYFSTLPEIIVPEDVIAGNTFLFQGEPDFGEAEQLLDEQMGAISLNALDLIIGFYPDAIEQEGALERILYLTLDAPAFPDMQLLEYAAQIYRLIFWSAPLHEEALSNFVEELRDVCLDDSIDEDAREFIEALLIMMCEKGTGIVYLDVHEQALALLKDLDAVPPGLITAS